MSDQQRDLALALGDDLQPPMANGEVLFEQPWHGRVFGMAVALFESGAFAWSEFQQSLIEVVGRWDRSAGDGDPYEYYEHFETALQQLMVAKGLLQQSDIQARTAAFAARPHGHDHTHSHDHDQ